MLSGSTNSVLPLPCFPARILITITIILLLRRRCWQDIYDKMTSVTSQVSDTIAMMLKIARSIMFGWSQSGWWYDDVENYKENDDWTKSVRFPEIKCTQRRSSPTANLLNLMLVKVVMWWWRKWQGEWWWLCSYCCWWWWCWSWKRNMRMLQRVELPNPCVLIKTCPPSVGCTAIQFHLIQWY